MLHRSNKMVWAGVNGQNLHTEHNNRWCCGQEQNKMVSPNIPFGYSATT